MKLHPKCALYNSLFTIATFISETKPFWLARNFTCVQLARSQWLSIPVVEYVVNQLSSYSVDVNTLTPHKNWEYPTSLGGHEIR